MCMPIYILLCTHGTKICFQGFKVYVKVATTTTGTPFLSVIGTLQVGGPGGGGGGLGGGGEIGGGEGGSGGLQSPSNLSHKCPNCG
jgi:hypothetical protein